MASAGPTTTAGADCTPATALVDPEATPEARCLAATLDRWTAAGEYGTGQQLNTSSKQYLQPLDRLAPDRPAVVGFDLGELGDGQTYGFPTAPLDALLQQNAEGAVLMASWHADNPGTGGDSFDRRWQDLQALVDGHGHAAHRFWSDYDDQLALLGRLQDGDGGRYPPAAVVFRPLHEANGNWFWWAHGADPSAYKALYAAMQQRAADRGVHDIVWGWSFNVVNGDNIGDPMPLRPDHVDLVGIDTYESMVDRAVPDRQMNLSGLAELAGSAPRIAVTEAGPLGSPDGNWDPRSVARAASAGGLHPSFVLLWFDDGDGSDGSTGRKQISSLRQGPSWLAGCPDGVCVLS